MATSLNYSNLAWMPCSGAHALEARLTTTFHISRWSLAASHVLHYRKSFHQTRDASDHPKGKIMLQGKAAFMTAFAIPVLLIIAVFAAETGDDEIKTVTIRPVDNEMKYATTEIKAKAGSKLTIEFENTATSSAMHHNVTVLKSNEAISIVGKAALTAKEHGYIPPKHEDKIIAHTEMTAPGQTREVTFTVPPPGKYPYICTFPGHFSTMQGMLTSVK